MVRGVLIFQMGSILKDSLKVDVLSMGSSFLLQIAITLVGLIIFKLVGKDFMKIFKMSISTRETGKETSPMALEQKPTILMNSIKGPLCLVINLVVEFTNGGMGKCMRDSFTIT